MKFQFSVISFFSDIKRHQNIAGLNITLMINVSKISLKNHRFKSMSLLGWQIFFLLYKRTLKCYATYNVTISHVRILVMNNG